MCTIQDSVTLMDILFLVRQAHHHKISHSLDPHSGWPLRGLRQPSVRILSCAKNKVTQYIHTGFFYFLVTNNSSPSLGIFATPARCFLCSENIAPPHKSEKEQNSLLFLDSRFCARYRILDLPSRVLFHLASLVRKSLSNPVAREAVHELSRSKIISIIFVHDTGFEPVTFPTSRGRSTD